MSVIREMVKLSMIHPYKWILYNLKKKKTPIVATLYVLFSIDIQDKM